MVAPFVCLLEALMEALIYSLPRLFVAPAKTGI